MVIYKFTFAYSEPLLPDLALYIEIKTIKEDTLTF